jgi:HEPN domain-containing protein
MSPSERVFQKAYAPELQRLAAADLKAAEALSRSDVRKEIVLFQAQQAIEKSLKAVLCFQGKPIPMTHELNVLIDRLDRKNLPPGGIALHDFTPYATIRRYEEGKFELTAEDLSAGLELAKQVVAWAAKELSR